MATSAKPLPAVREAFEALVDYAGLFPPAELPMRAAFQEYDTARSGTHAWMLGRFIVPASRLHELVDTATSLRSPQSSALSVIVDAGSDPRAWFSNVQALLARVKDFIGSAALRVETIEVALAPLVWARETYDAPIGQFGAAAANAQLQHLPIFVELPRGDRWRDLLPGAFAALGRHRLRAKLRCGGISADAVPSHEDVAFFITQAREAGIAFKATAGLHHPIRRDALPGGDAYHGFLNVLTGASLAASSFEARSPEANRVAPGEVLAALEDREPTHFKFDEASLHWNGRSIDSQTLERTRREIFVSYGSCSFSEPIDDLKSLGIFA